MLYHSHDRDLDFELGGRRYVVPKGSSVEIPDRLAYCIESRGLMLMPGGMGEKVAPTKPEARPAVPPVLARSSVKEMAEELADVTGEDPGDEPEDDEEDGDTAQKTADQLSRQGIELPGRRPGRPKK